MSKSNPFKKTIRKVNALFTRLSWLYLIIISLIVLLFIQWYTGSTRPNSAFQATQTSRMQQLENKLNEQQQLIESMQKEIQELKQRSN